MMKRREFITLLGSAAAWPLAAGAQQRQAMPVVAFINGSSPDASAAYAAAFRAGLRENGYIDGQSLTIEYHWLEGQYDRLPALIADLVRRRVAVIATPGEITAAIAAKAATSAIPIVFSAGTDPVRLGLVASLARPGGNATGMNFFAQEAVPKRLGLLHELVPKADGIAVLVDPSDSSVSDTTLQEANAAAGLAGLKIDVLHAKTSREIDEAFAILARQQAQALMVGPGGYFFSRRVQIVTHATRLGIATAFGNRAFADAGALMSYGTNIGESFRQVGAYAGQILKGTKPADLPVVQSTRFEFIINMQTARVLGIAVPPFLLAQADEVIE
jgi:putative tryptophan/tyrosine transport system substrate-binding protein